MHCHNWTLKSKQSQRGDNGSFLYPRMLLGDHFPLKFLWILDQHKWGLQKILYWIKISKVIGHLNGCWKLLYWKPGGSRPYIIWALGPDDFLVPVGDQYQRLFTYLYSLCQYSAEPQRQLRWPNYFVWHVTRLWWWSHTHSRAGATPRPPHFRLGQRSPASGRAQTSDALHYLSLIVVSSLLWLITEPRARCVLISKSLLQRTTLSAIQ